MSKLNVEYFLHFHTSLSLNKEHFGMHSSFLIVNNLKTGIFLRFSLVLFISSNRYFVSFSFYTLFYVFLSFVYHIHI